MNYVSDDLAMQHVDLDLQPIIVQRIDASDMIFAALLPVGELHLLVNSDKIVYWDKLSVDNDVFRSVDANMTIKMFGAHLCTDNSDAVFVTFTSPLIGTDTA